MTSLSSYKKEKHSRVSDVIKNSNCHSFRIREGKEKKERKKNQNACFSGTIPLPPPNQKQERERADGSILLWARDASRVPRQRQKLSLAPTSTKGARPWGRGVGKVTTEMSRCLTPVDHTDFERSVSNQRSFVSETHSTNRGKTKDEEAEKETKRERRAHRSELC